MHPSLSRLLSLPLAAAPLLAQAQAPSRDLDQPVAPWRTVRSGEGFRATVFGVPIDKETRDRRSSNSWDAGFGPAFDCDDADVQATAYLYFWRHPEDGHLLRAVLAGIYDEVLFARPLAADGFEYVLTFANDTAPWATSERIDGIAQDREELAWGYVRPGAGLGWRRRIGPEQDNLAAVDAIVEPGLLWFADGDRTDPAFATPDTTFELRTRLMARLDLLERNLLELPHRGFALGADAVHGWRASADDWGLPGVETHDGSAGKDYVEVTGYAFGITDIPGMTERQRVFGSVHAGDGGHTDRFSAQRLGGGPDRRGIEFETTALPLLPGAARSEFFPDHYLITSLGLRQEIAFFAFVDAGVNVAWLDRDHQQGAGRTRSTDRLTSVFAHLNSGCFGSVRFQLGYAYGFDLIRDGERGGSEVLLQVTGRF